MKRIIALTLVCLSFSTQSMWHVNQDAPGPKVLHLGFHKGCLNDFNEVAKQLGINLTSWYVLDAQFSRKFFDGCDCGNQIYNITSERAARIWDIHKDFFNSFDVIVTSDTAPLSRIFLESTWDKPLIIWVCNRFDYYHGPCPNFPDQNYYKLMREAKDRPNVHVVAYTDFERLYAQKKGVDLGDLTIRPTGKFMNEKSAPVAGTAQQDTSETLFIYPRFDTTEQLALIENACRQRGIATYCGVYDGPAALKQFKGLIYFPYSWSSLALFENLNLGIVHFVPSIKFLQELNRRGAPLRPLLTDILKGPYHLCDWYHDDVRDGIIYFDSWDDLKDKIQSTDYQSFSARVKEMGASHGQEMLNRWRVIFDGITKDMVYRNLPTHVPQSDEYGLKALHLGFHQGCIKDMEAVAERIGLNITSWYILEHEIPKDFFEGYACGNAVYNISEQRANRIWGRHKDFFDTFDVIKREIMKMYFSFPIQILNPYMQKKEVLI